MTADATGTQYVDLPILSGESQNQDARAGDGMARLQDAIYRRIGGITPRRGHMSLQVQLPAPQYAPNSLQPGRLFRFGDRLLIERQGVLRDVKTVTSGSAEASASTGQGPLARYYAEREPIYGSNVYAINSQAASGSGTRMVVWTQQSTRGAGLFDCFFELWDEASNALRVGPRFLMVADGLAAQVCFVARTTNLFVVVSAITSTTLQAVTVSPEGVIGTMSGTMASSTLPAFRIAPAFPDPVAPGGGNNVFIVTGTTGGNRTVYYLSTALSPPAVTHTLSTPVSGSSSFDSFAIHPAATDRVYTAYGTQRKGYVDQIDYSALPIMRAQGAPLAADALAGGSVPFVQVLEIAPGEVVVGATFTEAAHQYDACKTKWTRAIRSGSAMNAVAGTDLELAGWAIDSDLWLEEPLTAAANDALVFCGMIPGASSVQWVTQSEGGASAANPGGFDPAVHFADLPALGCGVVVHVKAYGQTPIVAKRPAPMATYAVGQVAAFGLSMFQDAYTLPDAPWAHRLKSQQGAIAAGLDVYGAPTWSMTQACVSRFDTPPAIQLVRFSQVHQRHAIELAGRLLVTGGTPSLFDGRICRPWGFLDVPYISLTINNPPIPQILPGSYVYAAHYEFIDANGDVLPCAPTVLPLTKQNANFGIDLAYSAPHLDVGTLNDGVRVALFRTEANRTTPYHRLTPPVGLIPQAIWHDDETDVRISARPQMYTEGDVFAADPPPSSRFAVAWQNRLVLAGTDDDSIYFSTEVEQGVVNYFTGLLRVPPFAGGRVNGLGVIDDKLIVFKRGTIWLVQNTLPANNGVGGQVPIPVLISTDTGCIDGYSVVSLPDGLMFRSARGIYTLDRGLNLGFTGENVTLDVERAAIIKAPLLVPEFTQVRFDAPVQFAENDLEAQGPVLLYDYLTKTWSRALYYPDWNTLGTCPTSQTRVKNKSYFAWATSLTQPPFLAISDPESEFYNDWIVSYAVPPINEPVIQTAWIHPDGPLQGYFRAHHVHIFGQWGDQHLLNVEIFADFNPLAPVYTRGFNLVEPPEGGYQFRVSCANARTSRMQAIAIRVTIQRASGGASGLRYSPPAIISGIGLEYSSLGTTKRMPATQKG